MAEEDRPSGARDDAMQALIGKKLRTLYESVLAEPIPDKIVDLLVKLDDVPVGSGGAKDGSDGAVIGGSSGRFNERS